MKVESYSCDVCGANKTPSNGWWIAYSFADGRFNIRPWEDTELTGESEHICGETCMAKLVTAHMAKWLSAQKELSQRGE